MKKVLVSVVAGLFSAMVASGCAHVKPIDKTGGSNYNGLLYYVNKDWQFRGDNRTIEEQMDALMEGLLQEDYKANTGNAQAGKNDKRNSY